MKIKSHKKTTLICILVPLLACIVYAVLCMLNLNSSIWFDESYSAYLIRGDFGDIWSMTAMDVHPPLFYFLLKTWSLIFGYTAPALRFMSIFFGALGLILLFHLLKRWFNVKAASVATVLTALSPMLIRYGQEMRMYTLVFFLVIAATYALDLALETKKNRYYILYAVLISLGMWTHYFTALAWLAHIAYYVFVKHEKFFSRKMILTYALAVAMFLPWFPSLIHQVINVEGSGFWIPSFSLQSPADYLSQSLMYSTAEYAIGWLALAGIIVVIFTTFFLKRAYAKFDKNTRPHFWFLITLVLIPPLILVILSLPPLTSMFVDRYIIYTAALLWTLIGLALYFAFKNRKKSIKTLIAPLIFIAAIITCAVTGVVNTTNRTPDGFVKDTITAVQAIALENEPIIMNNEWNYYDAVFYSTDAHPIYGVHPWINYQYGSIIPIEHIGYNLIHDIDEFTNEHDRIWYITDLNDDTKDSKLDREILAEKYRIVSTVADEHLVAFELEKR